MSLTAPEEILTPRLALIPITPAALHSEQAQDNQLTHLIQAEVPSNWPPVDWEPHVFEALLAQYAASHTRSPGTVTLPSSTPTETAP